MALTPHLLMGMSKAGPPRKSAQFTPRVTLTGFIDWQACRLKSPLYARCRRLENFSLGLVFPYPMSASLARVYFPTTGRIVAGRGEHARFREGFVNKYGLFYRIRQPRQEPVPSQTSQPIHRPKHRAESHAKQQHLKSHISPGLSILELACSPTRKVNL
jgi:hypothetical protein